MDKISNVLKEVIDMFINEELSINSNLDKAVEKAASEIMSKYRNNDIIDEKKISIKSSNDGVIYSVKCVTIKCNIDVFDSNPIPCIVNIYELFDEEIIDKIYSEFDLGSHSNSNNGSIEINIYSVNKGINLQWLRHLLYHECEHSLQTYLSNKSIKPNNSYIKAKNIILNNDIHHKSEMFIKVAWLLYYYSKLEIDGNVNGLYGEMMTDHSIDYEHTNFHRSDIEINEYFEEIIGMIGNNELDGVFQYFGYTSNSFVKYIIRQKKYLKIKVMRVLTLASNKRKSISENLKRIPNKLKHKPIGEYIK